MNYNMSNYWIAASEGDLAKVQQYITQGGVAVNAQDPQGYSAIHAAASYDHIELLEYLVSQGGDVNLYDEDGDSALHHCESVEAAKWLVDHGCDYTHKNNENKSAAEFITEEGEFEPLARYLTLLEECGNAELAWEKFNMPAEPIAQGGFENQLKAFMKAPEEELSEEMVESRKQLEQIMTQEGLSDEQRDEKLKEYVMQILGGQSLTQELSDDTEQRDSKRRK